MVRLSMLVKVHSYIEEGIPSARQVLMRLARARQVTGNFIVVGCDGENLVRRVYGSGA
jgi:hypothetical protein